MAAIALSERMVLLPLASMDGSLPSPTMAWQQAQEWQGCGASLIAVDITAPQLARDGIESLARLWVPHLLPAKQPSAMLLLQRPSRTDQWSTKGGGVAARS